MWLPQPCGGKFDVGTALALEPWVAEEVFEGEASAFFCTPQHGA